MRRRGFLLTAGGSLAVLSGCGWSSTSNSTDTSPHTTGETSDRPPASDVLQVQSTLAVEGTNVNIGVQGVAKNIATVALVECVVEASGTVGRERFSGRTEREYLPPGETWEWEVAFGEEADASTDDSVEDIVVETRATYNE